MERIVLLVEAGDTGTRLDRFVAVRTGATRSAAERLITEGRVTIKDSVPAKSYKVQEGDTVLVEQPNPEPMNVRAENIPLDICYEDTDLLVVNKPKGMVVHPAPGNWEGTLVNALLAHCGASLSGINGVIRPGIVHRIDKDTSGLLIVAKNDFAHQSLAGQIKVHSFTRRYEAVVHGGFRENRGTVDAPIGRHPENRKRMAVTEKNSRNAVTHYRVITQYRAFTHLELQLETGRTHQIRVHMAYLGHPVAGDPVYGPKKSATDLLQGQCLHARVIGFQHPRTGKYMEITSELPAYFTDFLHRLTKEETN